MTLVLLVLSNVLASLGLLGALVALGFPIYMLGRRFGLTDRAPLGLCWLFGLAWLAAWSWYGVAVDIRPTAAYRALFLLAPILGGLALVFLLPRPEQRLRGGAALTADVGLDLTAFVTTVLVYSGLIFSNLRPDDLPWATIFDADIYVYLKGAAWLSFAPVAIPTVGWTDFQSFVHHDVFGCFNLLAFGRFVLHTGLEHLPIPTLGVAVGMIGIAVSRSCRLAFRLRLPLALAVMLTITTGPLFLYVVLNYFMSETVFISILLTIALQSLEPEGGGERNVAGRALVLSAGAIVALLYYDVWALQYAVLLATLFAVTEGLTSPESRHRRVLVVVLSFVARFALALGAMALVSPTRLLDAVEKLRIDSVPNIAGWALPFVDLDLLVGLPVEWQGMDVPRLAIAGPVLGFLLLLAVLSLAVAKLDQGPGLMARRFTLGCFCAMLLAYLAVWLKFGETYQQWKFASTLPMGFGFAVLASAVRVFNLGKFRRLAGTVAMAFLLACVALNIGIARDLWLVRLAHVPAALASLARTLDAAPSDGPVHVTLDDFNTRHVAMIMLNHRAVTFDGLTMFGASPPPPASGRRTVITAECGTTAAENARYVAVPADSGYLPVLPAERQVPLSGDVATCVQLSGFGAAQPWGRSTDAATASIRFRCGCSPSSQNDRLAVKARMPEGTISGKVRLTVAGSPTPIDILLGPDFRDIEVPLPKGIRDEGIVELTIEVSGVKPDTEPAVLQVAQLTMLTDN